MVKIITKIFDVLFPPRKTETVLRSHTADTFTLHYKPGIYRDCIYLSNYTTPIIKAAITENKFHANPHASILLASLLSTWLAKQSGTIVCIPIPLSKKRLRSRGYNQVIEILKRCNYDHARISLNTKICARTKDTSPQTSLAKEARLQNMVEAFVFDKGYVQQQRDVTFVIVDDVCTTGATLRAARAALAPHLDATSSVICVALAH